MTDNGGIARDEVAAVWDVITQVDATYDWGTRGKPSFIQTCCEDVARRCELAGVEVIGRRYIRSSSSRLSQGEVLSEDFVESVNKLLPAQPWKPGVHAEIAAKLQCGATQVWAAIQLLISRGEWHIQKDGVVYDASGKVIAVDPERTSV
jgi:hypothetical protein